MSFTIHNWAGDNGVSNEIVTRNGYNLNVVIAGDIHVAARTLFDDGLNVMLRHFSNGETVLYVDSKGFTQR